MPKLSFTQEEVDAYFKGTAQSCFRKEAIDMGEEMSVHADGCFPTRLVRERRPNEPEEVLKYREKIWEPITAPKFSKIFSSLQKIRRSSEWAIKYPDLAQFSKIVEEDDLESYCEANFPMDFKSVTNWTFSILLRQQLIDPNSVVFITPLTWQVEANAYLEPFPEIYDSCLQIDYREGDYAVLLNPAGAIYNDGKDDKTGDSFFFITTEMIWQYDQTGTDRIFKKVSEITHGLGFLPVFKIKGILVKQKDRQFLYKSRISSIIPELNEALREYSDLQAAKVNHIYPERWEYTNNECVTCRGTGIVPNPRWTETCGCEQELQCHHCHGHGYRYSGPYSKMLLKPNSALSPDGQIPTPPAGYIEKDVEVVKVQQEGVDAHMYKALAAINFEFLEKAPLDQSGVAKQWDRDEANNTVHSIAEDTIACMDKIYRTIAHYRYNGLYSFEEVDNMLPVIPVPQTYDLVSAEYLEQELGNSKKNNVNSIILNALEVDYASRRFTDQEIRDMVALSLTLDPLPNVPEADKVLMLQNEGITQLTYVVSCNITAFIQRAMDEHDDFAELELKEQKEIIQEYGQEQIDQASKARAIIKSLYLDNGGNGLNNNNGDIQPNPENNIDGPGQVPQSDTGVAGDDAGGAPGTAPAA